MSWQPLDRLVGIFGLLFAAAVAWRVFTVYRQTGKLPVVITNGDQAHDFVHKVLAAVILLQGINILFFRLGTPYAYLAPFPNLETQGLRILGLVLAYMALIWSIIAQSQMGKDWRVGNDVENATSLITHGLYKISRHPIYLGFIVVTIGLFLATPNALTLLCVVLAIVVLSIEARLEEQFQLTRHGDVYQQYLHKTRRWI